MAGGPTTAPRRPRGWLSLHTRTLVVASIGVLVVLVTDSTVSIRSVSRDAQAALDEHATLLVTTQAQALAVPLWDYDRAQTQAVLEAIASDPDFQAVRIRDAKGEVIHERLRPGSAPVDALNARHDVTYKDGGRQRVLGTLDIDLSTARLSATVRTGICHEILFQLGVLGAVLLTLHAALRRVTRPLGMIAQVTSRLAAGDHGVPVPALDRADEVGAVARAIQVFKENAIALARAEEKYRAIYENAALGISRRDPDGRLIEWNPALVRIAGFGDEGELRAALGEASGGQWYADAGQWDELFRLLGQENTVSGFVSRIHRRDGTLAWVSESARAIRDGQGRVLFVESTIEDITERRRLAEDERLRVRAAVESASDSMAIVDAEGVPVYVNSAFQSLFGYGLAELAAIGGPTRLFVDPALGGEVLSALRRGAGWAGEADIRASDGTVVPVALRASTIADAGSTGSAGSAFILTDVSERKQAELRLRHMAEHDVLTGLPNRAVLRQRLEQAVARGRRTGASVGVFCLDLDRFKHVNDTLGHGAGDRLLALVADRLRANLQPHDAVSRLGGDEFVIVQTEGVSRESAGALGRRLIAALSKPFDLDAHEVMVGTSVGVALFPADGDDADRLLRRADLALYRAKQEGGGIHWFFDPQLDARLEARATLERDLRTALAGGEFELAYQPQVDIERHTIIGAEALLRWRHPERGMISPADFIPVAEETGLITPIGEWVLRTACAEAMSWPAHLRVAVNLSPVQFRHCDLAQVVGGILAETGLPPSRLEVEITEGVLLRETSTTLAILRDLKALGVRIAMDDFGTGYSSLNYLRRFPFDKVKMDQSFVRDLGRTAEAVAIVRAVVALARSFDMRVIAEGVETAEQADLLWAEGCTEVQGYLFGRPSPPGQFLALALAWPGGTEGRATQATLPLMSVA